MRDVCVQFCLLLIVAIFLCSALCCLPLFKKILERKLCRSTKPNFSLTWWSGEGLEHLLFAGERAGGGKKNSNLGAGKKFYPNNHSLFSYIWLYFGKDLCRRWWVDYPETLYTCWGMIYSMGVNTWHYFSWPTKTFSISVSFRK